MASQVGLEVPGTYDDQPEHPVRTVLAVPITVVRALDATQPAQAAPAPPGARRHASAGRHRHGRSGPRPRAAARGPSWRSTAVTGLGAAVTVFALVATLLLLVQLALG